MRFTFSPYDFQYRIKNGKVRVYLYGKTTNEENEPPTAPIPAKDI